MISLFKILNELEINQPGINYQKEWDRIKKEIMDDYGYDEGYFDNIDDEDEDYDELSEDEINRMVDEEFEELYPGKLDMLQEDNVTGGSASFTPGYGENYATPFAFGKKRKSKKKKGKFKSKTFDVVSWREGLNELEINKPFNITIGIEETDEDGDIHYWIDEDLVLKYLIKKFPNNKTNIIDWVEELNDFGASKEDIITTQQQLVYDFQNWYKNENDWDFEEDEQLDELEINKPGGKKISLQSFKDNMKNWFDKEWTFHADIDFEGLNKEIDLLKTKKELIDFIMNEELIGDDWSSLLDFIIDNTINI